MEKFSPYAALEENAARQANADAIIIGDTTIAHGEMLERVTAAAGFMLHHGLVPGESSGVCIRDEVGHIVHGTALMCLGTPQISLGSHENETTKRELMRKVGVTQLVVEKVEPWMEGARIIVVPPGTRPSSSAVPPVGSAMFGAWPLDSVAVYQNTSGSTNVPKTFGLSFARVQIIANRYAGDLKERRALRTGSIEFDAHRLNRICALLAGNTCVFLRHLDARELVATCERASVSTIHMGAYRLASLLQSNAACGPLPSFTAVQSGGSRVPGRLRRMVKTVLTDNLWVQYATSEAGLISMASPDQHDAFPEGVGYPGPEVTFEIVDESGERLAPGEIGKIRLRKEIMPGGYVAERGATSNFQGGWFYPGDLVSQRSGEPLVFHGRSDDTMILNGINIFPSAIEDTLESHGDVQEAVAYPVRSRIHGEIPVAAVVLSAQAKSRDTKHLLEFCRQSLGIRGPRRIVVVDNIPRNPAGKPLRRELAGA
jgi:acyl-CoA synthetase (AMP-forming)/AMP-acid ligase II